jgi:hypothetical protein
MLKLSFSFSIILLFLTSCNPNNDRKTPTAAVIFYNGDILTMEGDSAHYVDAVAIAGGKIVFVGSSGEAIKYSDDSTVMYDLNGKTLLPGFMDAHGHVGQYASLSGTADLQPPPYGTVLTVPALVERLKKYIEDKKIPAGAIVLGTGYDDAIMEEHRHPTAIELDAVSKDHPIYIMHASGHMGVANSLFLQKIGINNATPNPAGGTIVRDKTTGKPTGLMLENANINALLFLYKHLPPQSLNDQFKALTAAENTWFENGQTTICDGRTSPDMIRLIRQANDSGLLRGDFIVLPDYDLNKDSLLAYKKYYRHYDGHFKIGAIKMTFDGSPQGKSAWLTEPYLIPPIGEKPGFKGHPIYSHLAAYNGLKAILQTGMQAHIHCNGDAAIDEGLSLFDTLQQQGIRTSDMRCAIIHAQVCRPDQVPRFKQLGIMPSWFPTHCYLWGEWHVNSVLGLERAQHISPLMSGLKNGIRFTIHHDAPVTPPDLITAVYSAVTRKTRSGPVLGPDERISPYEALKAVTINVAWQWSEENDKGTLTPGKRADLVILDNNPLKVPPAEIYQIRVMETIKDGHTVYKRP